MRFYLGIHKPNWLREVSVPLFVSRRMLSKWKTPPRACGTWALDSGGFSELGDYGEWRTTPEQYLAEVRRWRDEVGNLEWAAIQDWMCEPKMLKMTGLTVAQHQERTIDSYIELKSAIDFRWTPVLQGWKAEDYWHHWERYEKRGVSLESLPLVGIGSICRRQGTSEAEDIICSLAKAGLRLHGFGFKQQGLEVCHKYLASADSMAWSLNARKNPPLPGCVTHKNCANCLRWALRWREKLLNGFRAEPNQESLLWQLLGETSASFQTQPI